MITVSVATYNPPVQFNFGVQVFVSNGGGCVTAVENTNVNN
jgi:hypothetical protein